jgi:hypothetical protein
VCYFITHKQDVTRWSSWEDRREIILREYPKLKKALMELQEAEDYLSYVIEKISDDIKY